MSHQQQHQHCFTSLFRFADRRLPLQLTSSRSHLGCLCASAFHWCLRQTLSVSAFTSLVVRRTAQLTLSVVLSLSRSSVCVPLLSGATKSAISPSPFSLSSGSSAPNLSSIFWCWRFAFSLTSTPTASCYRNQQVGKRLAVQNPIRMCAGLVSLCRYCRQL